MSTKLCSVDYTVGWIPASLSLTAADKQVLATERGVDPKHTRGSYCILGGRSDHPVIKQGLALREALSSLKAKYFVPEAIGARTAAGSERATVRYARSSYVIAEDSIEAFMREFDVARPQYLQWATTLCDTATYTELKDLARSTCGASWSVLEAKYPSQAALLDSVYCTTPAPLPISRSADLSGLPESLRERLRAETEERLSLTTQNIEALLLTQFRTFIEAVRRSCGNVVEVHPDPAGPWAEYADAAVVELRDNDYDPMQYDITLRKPNERRTVTLTLAKDVYLADFKPAETDEYRRLTDSTFSNLLDVTAKISRFRNELRNIDDQEFLASFAQDIESTLQSYGATPASIVNTLRDNATQRDELKRTFDGLLSQLQESGTATRARQFHTRRRIMFDE